jgi:hypothetical protein
MSILQIGSMSEFLMYCLEGGEPCLIMKSFSNVFSSVPWWVGLFLLVLLDMAWMFINHTSYVSFGTTPADSGPSPMRTYYLKVGPIGQIIHLGVKLLLLGWFILLTLKKRSIPKARLIGMFILLGLIYPSFYMDVKGEAWVRAWKYRLERESKRDSDYFDRMTYTLGDQVRLINGHQPHCAFDRGCSHPYLYNQVFVYILLVQTIFKDYEFSWKEEMPSFPQALTQSNLYSLSFITTLSTTCLLILTCVYFWDQRKRVSSSNEP